MDFLNGPFPFSAAEGHFFAVDAKRGGSLEIHGLPSVPGHLLIVVDGSEFNVFLLSVVLFYLFLPTLVHAFLHVDLPLDLIQFLFLMPDPFLELLLVGTNVVVLEL
jgi:hypothetical protein